MLNVIAKIGKLAPILFLILASILSYLLIFKERFDLLYSIDQVEILHKPRKERLKLAILIGLLYMILAIAFLVDIHFSELLFF